MLLKVTFEMASPLAFWGRRLPYPPMLDSLLAYHALRRRGVKKTDSEAWERFLIQPELPLDVEERAGKKFYCASAAFVPPGSSLTLTYVTKGDVSRDAAMLGVPMEFSPRSGPYRAYVEPYFLLAAPEVWFYLRGDPEGVRSLLQAVLEVGFLGSTTRCGWGRIRRVVLERAEGDFSVWRPDGLPSRPVPALPGEPGASWSSWTFPYWHPSRKCWCLLPPVEQWLPLPRI